MLQKRVAEIALINVDRIPNDRAGFGSTVHVVERTGEKLVFQLVMPEDADAAKGLISTTSPIGRAFLNKEAGRLGQGRDAGRHARVRNRQAVHHPRRSRRNDTMRLDVDPPPSTAEPYSPHRRTALVLTGTGTAGAYHAGVLRALHEAGVKLDVVAGRGIGVVGALFAAVDGAQRLWDDEGLLARAAAPHALRLAPAAARDRRGRSRVVAGDRRHSARGHGGRPGRVSDRFRAEDGRRRRRGRARRRVPPARARRRSRPTALPTWLPRLVLLVLGARRQSSRRSSAAWTSAAGDAAAGAFWWRLVPAAAVDRVARRRTAGRVMWDLLRGAAQLKQPAPAELARRYVEMLADNLGQPGFRELLITVHDLDAHRDLVFALLSRDPAARSGPPADAAKRPSAGEPRSSIWPASARDHLADAAGRRR